MQDTALVIQDHLGLLAHIMERIKNVFNFSVPFLSWLAFSVILIFTIVLYLIPLRIILLMWGTNKFLKKLVYQIGLSNNSRITDFLSRVPDNEELKNFIEIFEA